MVGLHALRCRVERPVGVGSAGVSYDVEVATHGRPDPDGLEAPDGVTVDGPVAAEPDDLAEALAAAVLAPRWLTTLSVPYDASQRRRDALRSLARRLAQEHEGAAYDPQEDAVFFPRGRPKRVPAGKAEKTSIVRLEWYVDAERWAQAPAALLSAIARRCPEALPTRYGVFEPPQGRYDPAAPDAFTALARDDSAFWFASRPFFGGTLVPARARTPGRLGVEVDWRVLDSRPALARDGRRPVRGRGVGARRVLRRGRGSSRAGRCRATTASGSRPAARRASRRSAATAGRDSRPSRRG